MKMRSGATSPDRILYGVQVRSLSKHTNTADLAVFSNRPAHQPEKC